MADGIAVADHRIVGLTVVNARHLIDRDGRSASSLREPVRQAVYRVLRSALNRTFAGAAPMCVP